MVEAAFRDVIIFDLSCHSEKCSFELGIFAFDCYAFINATEPLGAHLTPSYLQVVNKKCQCVLLLYDPMSCLYSIDKQNPPLRSSGERHGTT
jgi:hypothetical protein